MKVWHFDEWFRLQHGARPGGNVPDEEMLEIVRRGDFYRAMYLERVAWDNRRTSALYAWQIPDGSKPAAHACLRAVRIYRPVWWALENPRNKVRRYLGPPRLTFCQWEYGDTAEKPTCIWGEFHAPMFRVGRRSKPSTWKTKAQNADPKDAITPPGFARAFFESNP